MRKLGKKILSLMMVAVMLAALVPTVAMPTLATDGEYRTFISDSGIDYTAPDVLVEGSSDGFVINLSKETIIIPDNYTIRAYSTDGGNSWKSARDTVFTDANFPRLLNKDIELRVTDNFDSRTNRPATEVAIVSFPKINGRPAAPNLRPNYEIYADLTGATPGAWVLTERNRTLAIKNGIEIAPANGRTVSECGYGRFYTDKGIPVQAFPTDGRRAARLTYFVRTAPVQNGDIFIAASNPARVNVTSEQRPPRYRARYKTEDIRLKTGDVIFGGIHENMGVIATEVTARTATLRTGRALRITGQRGSAVSISNHLTTNPETVVIRRGATASRAASAPQIYTLAPRATIHQETIQGQGVLSITAVRCF
jgi:hypothetical protein